MVNTMELLKQIEQLTDIGIALSSEEDTDCLLEKILLGAKSITNADGGTLYSVDMDKRMVSMEIIRTDSLNYAMGGTSGQSIPFPPISLDYEDGTPKHDMVVTNAVLNDQTINITNAYDDDGFDFSGTHHFDDQTGYHSQSFLTVPLKNHEHDIIGVLQLINAKNPKTHKIVPFSPESQRLTESLASQAAIALTNHRLINELNQLLESLIQLIAGAIDEKSKYTGGHCRRVPILTMLLADAAHAQSEGPFADFSMSKEDRYELEIAAWLHDCGKIVIPEYVVDKGTKLETIYDRIHTVNSRFEVLRKDAEITLLKQRIAALEKNQTPDEDQIQSHYQETLKRIEDDQNFIAQHNSGSEFMPIEAQERICHIAKQTITIQGKTIPLLSLNEIKNLNIVKGTLTNEERTIINHHIVVTIDMLNKLPFPKHLKNVPEFAGGHHERMDGKGYPLGLKKEDMSVQARIMAIADVFEALTAKDRPYKDGKKLSTALDILGKMKLDNHIDPDLFDLFVQQKVYQTYSDEYVAKNQIDEIDVQLIPGYLQKMPPLN